MRIVRGDKLKIGMKVLGYMEVGSSEVVRFKQNCHFEILELPSPTFGRVVGASLHNTDGWRVGHEVNLMYITPAGMTTYNWALVEPLENELGEVSL